MNQRNHVRFVAPIVISTALLWATGPIAGASSDEEATTHCYVEVIGETKAGEYLLSDEECFAEFDDAMSAIGLGDGITSKAEAESAAAALSSTIGIHYDGAGFTGSSFSVSGVNCLGGYINMSAGWNDRVSSTLSGFCGRIRHWTGANKTGSFQDTLPNGNLSAPVNNNVSSIQYLN